MFKRYLNYELQNIENEVRNRFSLAEFVGETLYSGNYMNFILTHEQNCIIFKYVFQFVKIMKSIKTCITIYNTKNKSIFTNKFKGKGS
jgi:hypothetical protein